MAAQEKEIRQERGILTVRVPSEIHDALRTLSYVTSRPINELVLGAIGDYLSTRGRQEEVEGFLHRAQAQYRTALDKLADL